MITTGKSGHHQQQQQQDKQRSKYGSENATDLNGSDSKTDSQQQQQTPSKLSNGIGGLLKRFTPNKNRSRSKSPAAHTQHRIEKSWVTVEIKDSHQNGGGSGSNYAPPPTTSCSSPSSPILRTSNGGGAGSTPTSPDKPPRSRGAWGNLFHRGSMKKTRDSSADSRKGGGKMEIRTRSEHELDNGEDIGGMMTSTRSTDLASGDRWGSTNAQRLKKENGGDIRDGYGALLAMTSAGSAANGTRGALSEEDLVSKSLSQERGDTYKSIMARGGGASGITTTMGGSGYKNGVQSSVPSSLTTATAYHSQDSVFDTPSRMPSYVRISCTLSGYRNYRNVDLKTAMSPRQQRATPKMHTTEPVSAGSVLEPASPPPPTSPVLPIGKSIVERRLEKFQGQHQQQQPQSPKSVVVSPPKETTVGETTSTDGTAVAATPTPIKDLISNFNKMTVHDPNSPVAGRPRQKPPPIPPKRDRLVDRIDKLIGDESHEHEGEQEFNGGSGDNGTKTNGVAISRSNYDEKEHQHQRHPETNLGATTHDSMLADSTMVERTVNGSFRRDWMGEDEGVTATVAAHTTESAVEEAMKHVSATFAVVNRGDSMKNGDDRGIDNDVGASRRMEEEEIEDQQTTTTSSRKTTTNGNGLVPARAAASATAEGLAAVVVDNMATGVDGFYYEKEAAKERERLEKLCADGEVDLNKEDVPEEAAEQIRIAVGRVRLFLRKKFAKFEELIQNNLHPTPDDPRPTHVSDLDGYNELVKMEIEDIDACFDVVRRLRENNWRSISTEAEEDEKKNRSKQVGQRTTTTASSKVNKPRPPAPPPPPPSGSSSQRPSTNARAEAAKQRLKEAKEAAMQRKKQQQDEADAIVEEHESN